MHITILCGERIAVAGNTGAPGRDQSRKSPFSEDVFVLSNSCTHEAHRPHSNHMVHRFALQYRSHTLLLSARMFVPKYGNMVRTDRCRGRACKVHRCVLQNPVAQHFVCWGSIRAEARLREVYMYSGNSPRSGRMMHCDLYIQSSISPLSMGKDVPKHVGMSFTDPMVVSGCTVA
jgi:hypothetical protein